MDSGAGRAQTTAAPAKGRTDVHQRKRNTDTTFPPELVAGTTRFIPVAVKGALFEAGDGHAAQGNGEVDITALETYLSGTFRFVVRKDRHPRWPRAETPTHFITMGFSKELKEAAELALRDMIELLFTQRQQRATASRTS